MFSLRRISLSNANLFIEQQEQERKKNYFKFRILIAFPPNTALIEASSSPKVDLIAWKFVATLSQGSSSRPDNGGKKG